MINKNTKIGKEKKIKKLKKNDFYKIEEDKDRKSMTYSQRETEFNELRIHQNGVCFNYSFIITHRKFLVFFFFYIFS